MSHDDKQIDHHLDRLTEWLPMDKNIPVKILVNSLLDYRNLQPYQEASIVVDWLLLQLVVGNCRELIPRKQVDKILSELRTSS